MRDLALNEVQIISGGNEVLYGACILGAALVTALAIGACVNQNYTTYDVVTPIYDSNGFYTGYDKVDTYMVPVY